MADIQNKGHGQQTEDNQIEYASLTMDITELADAVPSEEVEQYVEPAQNEQPPKQMIETEAVGHIVTAEELVMDEATIIREQERLQQEKKRKKSAKRKKVVFSILGVILLGGIWFLGWGRKMLLKEEDNTVKIVTTAGQSISYVKVNSINGNELNITIMKEQEQTETEEAANGNGEMPSGMPSFGDGEMPSGMPSFGDGEMPSGMPSFGDGEMPEGFSGGERPSRGDGSSSSGSSRSGGNTLVYNGTTYVLSEEVNTVQIPVGTVVTTKLGTATTFSRISAGDCLAFVTETINGKETIMAVYIIG